MAITPTYVAGNGYQWAPDLAAGVSMTSGTTPALGSWVEIISATLDDILIVGQLSSFNASTTDWTWIEFEIGLGISGSEAPVWQHKAFSMNSITAVGLMFQQMDMYPMAIKVPAGQRVAMRMASSVSSMNVAASLCYVRTQDVVGGVGH